MTGGALGVTIGPAATLWIAVLGAFCCVLWLIGTPLLRAESPAEEICALAETIDRPDCHWTPAH